VNHGERAICVQPNEPHLCRFWLAAIIAGVQHFTAAQHARSEAKHDRGSCYLSDPIDMADMPISDLLALFSLLSGYLYMYSGHFVPTCLRAPLCVAAASLWLAPGTTPGVPFLTRPAHLLYGTEQPPTRGNDDAWVSVRAIRF
jgi:hypothetical protein